MKGVFLSIILAIVALILGYVGYVNLDKGGVMLMLIAFAFGASAIAAFRGEI